jgi:hypothetical protein
MIRKGSLVVLLAVALLLAVPGVDAARPTSYSGTVAAIDPQGGVLVLDEIGPWRVAQGQTVMTRRTVVITSDTKVNTFIRVNVPGVFAGDFLEVALDADNLTVGTS